MSCACWGFTVAESGPLDLVRSRPNMPDERLALSPLFVANGKHAILQRWKLGAHEPLPDDLGYLGMFRPAVTVMTLGDYDHDGRSTEFVLQIGASACFDSAAVSRSRNLTCIGRAGRVDYAVRRRSPSRNFRKLGEAFLSGTIRGPILSDHSCLT